MSSNHLKWLLCDPISEHAVCSRPRTVGIFLAPSLGVGRRWFCLFFGGDIIYNLGLFVTIWDIWDFL